MLHHLHTCSGFRMCPRQFGRSCSDGGHGRYRSPPWLVRSAAGCKIQAATGKIGIRRLAGVDASAGRPHEEDERLLVSTEISSDGEARSSRRQ